MRAVRRVAGGRAFAGGSEAIPPLAFSRVQPFCGADSVFSQTRTHVGNACCVLYNFFFFFVTHPERAGLLSRFTGEETEAQRGRPGQGHAASGNGGT